MSHRISAFIYSKLEIISGFLTSGVSSLALDPLSDFKTIIIKGILAVAFGFLGAFGAWLFKKYIIKEK